MNYLLKFFELLKFSKVMCDLEFEMLYEIITVTKRNDCYLFKCHKSSPLLRTNLCQEIILITEESADFKIKLNHPLSLYFDRKAENISIEDIKNIDIQLFEQDFTEHFVKAIEHYPNFQKIYSHSKLEMRLPEKQIHIKKTKI